MNKGRFFWVIVSIFLVGCATTTLGEKSSMLRVGMNKDEVVEIFGSPKTTSVYTSGDDIIEKWSFWKKKMVGYVTFDDPYLAGSSNRLTITFKNGVVQSWGDQLDYSNMMQETTKVMQETMKNMPPVQVEQRVYQGDAGK